MYSDTQVFMEVHNNDFQNFPAFEMSIQDMDSSLEFQGNIIVNENMETTLEDNLESKSDSSSSETLRSLWYNASSVTQAYGKILNDIKVTFLPSLVPEIHLQSMSYEDRSIYKAVDHSVSSFTVASMSTTSSPMRRVDEEERVLESPRQDFLDSSFHDYRANRHLPEHLIMRDEDIPETDGRKVVIMRSRTLRARSDPFVAEFYRKSVEPLLE